MDRSAYHVGCARRRREGKRPLPNCTCVARMNGTPPSGVASANTRGAPGAVWWADCMGRYVLSVPPRGVQPHWTHGLPESAPSLVPAVLALASATPLSALTATMHKRGGSASSFETNPYSDSPASEATTQDTSVYNSTAGDKGKGKARVHGGGSSSGGGTSGKVSTGKGPYGEGSSSSAPVTEGLHTKVSKVLANLRPLLRAMREHPGFNAEEPAKSHPISIAHLIGTTEITIHLFDTMTKREVNSGTAESLSEIIDIICRCTRIAEAVIDDDNNYQRLTQSTDRVAFGSKCVEDARKLMAAIDNSPQMRVLKPKKLTT